MGHLLHSKLHHSPFLTIRLRGEKRVVRPSPLRELQRNNEVVISWSRGQPCRCLGYFSCPTKTLLQAADVFTNYETWLWGNSSLGVYTAELNTFFSKEEPIKCTGKCGVSLVNLERLFGFSRKAFDSSFGKAKSCIFSARAKFSTDC